MTATYSSGSTVVWKYIVESTFGTTPVTPTMKVLRAKPSKLDLKKETYTTDEVRSDRAISDVRHGMRKVEGSIDGDFLFTEWDDFIEAALQGTWTADVCKLGTNLRSFSIEQGFTDIAQFRLFKGMCVSKMKVSCKPGSMAEISFDFIGRDVTTGTSTNATVTTPAGTTSPMSYNLGTITEGGGSIAYMTGIEFEVDNGLSHVGVIGSDLTPAVFNGRSSIKGTVTALFKDQVMLNKFLNETESSIVLTLIDPAANQHVITLPRVKYTGGDVAPPKEGAVIITLPFEALYDSGSSTNISWDRS